MYSISVAPEPWRLGKCEGIIPSTIKSGESECTFEGSGVAVVIALVTVSVVVAVTVYPKSDFERKGFIQEPLWELTDIQKPTLSHHMRL